MYIPIPDLLSRDCEHDHQPDDGEEYAVEIDLVKLLMIKGIRQIKQNHFKRLVGKIEKGLERFESYWYHIKDELSVTQV